MSFLLLCAYYFIKPVREALILSVEDGAVYKNYLSGGAAILLLFLVPLYGKLVDRWARNRLIVSVTASQAEASGNLFGLSKGEFIGQFYGNFFFYVNILGMLI